MAKIKTPKKISLGASSEFFSEFFPFENDPSHPKLKGQASSSIAVSRIRNAFWVVHPPFCLFFDGDPFYGESSFYNWAGPHATN